MSAGKNAGQINGEGSSEKFAEPMGGALGPGPIQGMQSASGSNSETTGFQTSGYIDKKGTPYGEAAKFNFMPPGMDIDNQENAVINSMPMKKLVSTSYPGDGWGSSRDIPE
jgi:hypothetical protein